MIIEDSNCMARWVHFLARIHARERAQDLCSRNWNADMMDSLKRYHDSTLTHYLTFSHKTYLYLFPLASFPFYARLSLDLLRISIGVHSPF